jgi:hypothetical protein
MLVSSIIGITVSFSFLEQELRTSARARVHKTDFMRVFILQI